MMRLGAAVLALCVAGPAVAQDAGPEKTLAFFEGQACGIGIFTRGLAAEQGITGADIDALIAADPGATQDGLWTVLSADFCQIKLPTVTSPIKITDPDVQPYIDRFENAEFPEDNGCFLRVAELSDGIKDTRGWSADFASVAYVQMLAEGVMSGDLRFYSETPLATPMGFRVMKGAGCDVPLTAAIHENHLILKENLGAFIREAGPQVACEEGASLMHPGAGAWMENVAEGRNKNAWLAFEYMIITMGAGWYQGQGATAKGTPRPPLCVNK